MLKLTDVKLFWSFKYLIHLLSLEFSSVLGAIAQFASLQQGKECGESMSCDRFVNLFPAQITHHLPINRHHTKYPQRSIKTKCHWEIHTLVEKTMMETAMHNEIYAKQAYKQLAVEILRMVRFSLIGALRVSSSVVFVVNRI